MALKEAAKEVVWVRGLVSELRVDQGNVQLDYDSKVWCVWARIKFMMQGQIT